MSPIGLRTPPTKKEGLHGRGTGLAIHQTAVYTKVPAGRVEAPASSLVYPRAPVKLCKPVTGDTFASAPNCLLGIVPDMGPMHRFVLVICVHTCTWNYVYMQYIYIYICKSIYIYIYVHLRCFDWGAP